MHRTLLLLALLVLTLTGCENGLAPGAHPAGVVLLDGSGSQVARFVYEGQVVTGGLNVGVGESVTYEVWVVTENGDVVPVDGSEHSIRDAGVVIGLAADVAIESPNRLRVSGLVAAQTSVRFHLYHAGHPEFLVSGIPLAVQ